MILIIGYGGGYGGYGPMSGPPPNPPAPGTENNFSGPNMGGPAATGPGPAATPAGGQTGPPPPGQFSGYIYALFFTCSGVWSLILLMWCLF